jgi:hypothetical protein
VLTKGSINFGKACVPIYSKGNDSVGFRDQPGKDKSKVWAYVGMWNHVRGPGGQGRCMCSPPCYSLLQPIRAIKAHKTVLSDLDGFWRQITTQMSLYLSCSDF